tara:strand:+ start:1435 stop:2421 length:987 start_codon:yes stop_codon:yes gene_type:complete
MKIFISIASYQDPLLEATIYSAYNNADNPKDLIFGICDQSTSPLDISSFEFSDQFKYEHVDPINSEGPCWARSRIQNQFNNEDYYLQIDSHMQFEKNWDAYLINYLERIRAINLSSHQLPIITCYPRAFNVVDLKEGRFELNNNEIRTDAISYRKDSMFIKENFSRQIGSIATQEISHGYLIAAGCLFSTGEFVKEIPYDSDYYFYGEEISLMIRAFTRGFGIFHIQSLPIFHLYAELTNIERKLHWNEGEDSKREVKWHQREGKSINKLKKLLNDEITGVFGLGASKSLKDYEYLSGIDLVNKKILDEEKAFTAKFISSLPWNESPF